MLLRVLPWAIWAGLMVFSVATYGGLPPEIPQRLNDAGEVTRSVGRTWVAWLALPLIAAAVQVLLTSVTLLLPSKPDLFNFPEKERFLQLPHSYRGHVIVRMQETLDAISVLTMLLLCGVQVLLWRVALGHASRNALPVILIGTLVFVPAALLLTSRVNSATEDAERKWKAATGGKDSRTSGPR
jgi:uncharacterized membrane protein